MWQKVPAEETCGHVAWHVLQSVPGEEAIKGMVAVQAGHGTHLALFGAGTQQCFDHFWIIQNQYHKLSQIITSI